MQSFFINQKLNAETITSRGNSLVLTATYQTTDYYSKKLKQEDLLENPPIFEEHF